MSTSNTEPAFNLLDEPWIPVRTLQGEMHEVSLSTVLLHADQYSGLAETSPPNLVALHRVLLAVLHRALTTHHGPWRDSDRAHWFRHGWPEQALRDYFTQWRDAFWLIHPDKPFMQVAALAQAAETCDKTKPWTQISLESASGNTPVVFDHALDDRPSSLPLSAACRSLLGYLQFTPGGLVKTFRDSDKAGPLANTAAALPIGNNLRQSLLLSLHPYHAQHENDQPTWEKSVPTIAALCAEPTLATGYNDRYTRLSRAVLFSLTPDKTHVQYIRFGAGQGLEEDVNAVDSMASYRINKDGKAIRISFTEGRAIWRELPVLLPDASGQHSHPPAVLGWAAHLYERLGQDDAPVQVLMAGLASDQAKLLRWRAEFLKLPMTLLTTPPAAQELRAHIQKTEAVYAELRKIATHLVANTMPDGDHKDTRSRARTIVTNGPMTCAYYVGAERGLAQLMAYLAETKDEEADTHWRITLTQAVQSARQALDQSLGKTPYVLRAQARADAEFGRLLASLRPLQTAPSLTATLEETL